VTVGKATQEGSTTRTKPGLMFMASKTIRCSTLLTMILTQAAQADGHDAHGQVCHPGIEPPASPDQHRRGQGFVDLFLDASHVAQQLGQHGNALETDLRCQVFWLEAQVERQTGGSLCAWAGQPLLSIVFLRPAVSNQRRINVEPSFYAVFCRKRCETGHFVKNEAQRRNVAKG